MAVLLYHEYRFRHFVVMKPYRVSERTEYRFSLFLYHVWYGSILPA